MASVPRWKRVAGGVLFGGGASFVCYLGFWQLRRARWKEGLVSSRRAALEASEPVELSARLLETHGREALLFRRVALEGRPLYEDEVALGVRSAPADAAPEATEGASHGRLMVTPFELADGSVALVNRGWVPEQHDAATWPEAGGDSVRIEGVVRAGEAMPAFVPEGELARLGMRNWHWLDADTLASRYEEGRTLPFVVDAVAPEPQNGKWPVRHQTKQYLEFSVMPFMHHIYAATWFSLTAGILVVGGLLLRRSGGRGAGRGLLGGKRRAKAVNPSDIYRKHASK